MSERDLKTMNHDELVSYFMDLGSHHDAEEPKNDGRSLDEIVHDVREFADRAEFLGVVDVKAE